MIRPALILALLLAATPAAVSAQASDVHVVLGPKLAKEARELGQRDLDRLTAELERTVERAVAQSGRASGARLELTLIDVRPSRPTFEQMARRPGLSMDSVSNGGAALEGVEISADGTRRPVRFSWYESDIRWAGARATWSDAHRAFDLFARQYASGKR
jgi:hypothetical protein